MAEIALRELGAELKDYREENDVSLRALARETGVSASTLSRVERGHVPDLEAVETLADFLGVTVRTAEGSTPSGRRDPEALSRQIRVHLRANKNLSEEAAREIARTAESYIDYLVDQQQDGPGDDE